jgi:hypothetical protein
MKKVKVLVVSVIVIVMAIALFSIFSACEKDEGECMTKAAKFKTSAISNSKKLERELTFSLPQNLTEDMVIPNGNAIASGGLNTNGYNVTVENGDLIINGSLNGGSSSEIKVSGTIDINGSINLNEMEIYCSDVIIFGSMNGPGFIYYCGLYDVNGSINNNNPNNQNILQQSNHCATLSSGGSSIDYEIVNVPCDYIGKTIDGYKYQKLN